MSVKDVFIKADQCKTLHYINAWVHVDNGSVTNDFARRMCDELEGKNGQPQFAGIVPKLKRSVPRTCVRKCVPASVHVAPANRN